MHELSIVNSIIKTLEMEFDIERRSKMKAIYLKVGILSNVEPLLLQNAYNAYYVTRPEYSDVALYVESVKLNIRCEMCDHITEVKNYCFTCAHCGRPCKNIIQGEELLIHKVAFKD